MRPVPVPRRSARSAMVRGAVPEPAICVSDCPAMLGGSLLDALTLNDAIGDTPSTAETVATVSMARFGGHRLHGAAGMPRIAGCVLSIEIRSVRGASELPARSVEK